MRGSKMKTGWKGRRWLAVFLFIISLLFAGCGSVSELDNEKDAIAQESLNVHFLDVGQGLSIFVQCDGLNLIYDGGDKETSSYVVAYLKNMGVETIDYMISSHYDSDHVSGLIGCLNAFDVKQVISSDYVHDSATYESFVSKVKEQGLTMLHPAVGETFSFGSAAFTILAPEQIDTNNSNENSVAIKLIHGDNSFVITGDAEYDSEAAMCASGLDLECDVLVAGHHGSATATSWDFLMETVPEYAVISCGEGNSYGHPHADVMEKLESMEVQIYRTDKQGWISVVSNGVTLDWSQEPCNDYSGGEGDISEVTSDEGTAVAGSQKTEQTSEQETNDYILNTNTKKFHYPSCSSVDRTKKSSKKEFSGTREDIINMGYAPCGNCNP